MKKGIIVCLTVIFLFGCGKKRLSKAAQVVEISYEQPDKSCKKIDVVQYSHFKGRVWRCDFESAKNHLRNQAAKKGANYLKLNDIRDEGVYCNGSGEAYKC